MVDIYNELIKKIDTSKIHINEQMKKHTSFKIGGPADIFVNVNNIEELKQILLIAKGNKTCLKVIGNGTNLLIRDKGVRGIIVKLNFCECKKINEDMFEVGAGMPLSKLSYEAYKEGLSGLEFAAGIPGTVGGAIRMNAGAHDSEIKDVVLSTTYMDEELNIREITNKEHGFIYRDSVFSRNRYIILKTIIRLQKIDKDEIKKKMDKNKDYRKTNQPINFANAGSIFKRGDNYITAQLIDKAGLKGYNVGDACVSEKHAGFIVNKGNASAKDVLKLIDIIKKQVKLKYNIDLELELEIIGEE